MTSSSGRKVDSGFAKELLALPLLNQDGLHRLLDLPDWLVYDDAGRVHRLADLCEDLADRPAAVPRSANVRLGTHARNGEFDAALHLTKVAHDGYSALGMHLKASREAQLSL